jgi:hypothetical protein
MTLVTVPIHGMPDNTTETPRDQLDALIAVCSSKGLMIWDDFIWATRSLHDVRFVFSLLRGNDSLSAVMAKRFSSWIRPRLCEIESDAKLVIIAYSFGGSIFYKWIRDEARSEEIGRISIAIVIAGFHQLPVPVYLQDRKKPVRVNEPPIPPQEIVTKLTSSRVRLIVLLGENDVTVPPVGGFGDFPTVWGVEQHVIAGVDHFEILTDPQVIDIVKTCLS